jgi:hypothetical protein
MSIAQPVSLWRRTLERSGDAFSRIEGPKLAAALCKRTLPYVTSEEINRAGEFALSYAGYPNRICEPLSTPDVWPWLASVKGFATIVVADDGRSGRDSFLEFSQVSLRAVTALASAPASILSRLDIEHINEASPTDGSPSAERWLAMLFAVSMWGNVAGSGVVVESAAATALLPGYAYGAEPNLAREKQELRGHAKSPSTVWWMTDLAAMSCAMVDAVLSLEEEPSPLLPVDEESVLLAPVIPPEFRSAGMSKVRAAKYHSGQKIENGTDYFINHPVTIEGGGRTWYFDVRDFPASVREEMLG